MELTKEFCMRWKQRVGSPVPNAEEVEAWLGDRGTIWIQRMQDLFMSNGKRYRVLAAYWVPDKAVIIKVDESAGRVVTVLSPGMRK